MNFDNIILTDPVSVDDEVMPAGTRPDPKYQRIVNLENASKLFVKFGPSIASVFGWLFEQGVSSDYRIYYITTPVPQDPLRSFVQTGVKFQYFSGTTLIEKETVDLILLLRNPDVAYNDITGFDPLVRYVFPEIPRPTKLVIPFDLNKPDPYFENSYLSVGLPIDNYRIEESWVEENGEEFIKKLRMIGFRVYHSWEKQG